jgi:hypothetical protein
MKSYPILKHQDDQTNKHEMGGAWNTKGAIRKAYEDVSKNFLTESITK